MEFNKFKKMADGRFTILWKDRYPCLYDSTSNTGFDPHYIYHTAWAARILKKMNPEEHVDFSSFLYFNTIASAFIPIKFYDYRPANIFLDNFKSGGVDLLNLPFANNSISSLSCMHVVEHIGLGRYGDEIDSEGDLRAIRELQRVTSEGGSILFVVPIGKPKIMFNAHRIYSYEQIVDIFKEFELCEFALIPNDNVSGIIYNANIDLVKKQDYACGCFWFKKTNGIERYPFPTSL